MARKKIYCVSQDPLNWKELARASKKARLKYREACRTAKFRCYELPGRPRVNKKAIESSPFVGKKLKIKFDLVDFILATKQYNKTRVDLEKTVKLHCSYLREIAEQARCGGQDTIGDILHKLVESSFKIEALRRRISAYRRRYPDGPII